MGGWTAALIWSVLVALWLCLLIATGVATGVAAVSVTLGADDAVLRWISAASYARAPGPKAETRMDTFAGLWVFACHAIAGFAPLAGRIP
ncbi:MAG: hypothetical protein H7245_14025 [Candidatus Saccharibacteria bacterium]|nr:hypothetical protein [Pseudorhodobacter sp.]